MVRQPVRAGGGARRCDAGPPGRRLRRRLRRRVAGDTLGAMMRAVVLVAVLALGGGVVLGGGARVAAGAPAGAPGDGIGHVEWDSVAEFTPTRTPSGTPLRWAGSCVFLRPHAAGAADIANLTDAVAQA